jgi:uroporphyrinogen decarboxylase
LIVRRDGTTIATACQIEEETMTPKERVEALFSGREPDRVPLSHMSVSCRVASEILGRDAYVGGGMQRWREAAALWKGPRAHAEFVERSVRDAIDFALATDQDLIRPGYWRDRRRPAARIDEYTFRYEGADGSWSVERLDPETEIYAAIDGAARPEPTIADLEREVEAAERAAEECAPPLDIFAEARAAYAERGETHAIRCSGAWSAIPVHSAAWMRATVERPDLVARLLDTQAITSCRNADMLAAMGADLCFGGGDMATDRGPMYSPRVFRELVLPCVRAISDHCHARGLKHLFGTDGNVWPIADDLYGESGIDGHYEFDRRAGMDPVRVHERFPHLVMLGNISCHLLDTGTPDEVREQTRKCIEQAKATNKVIAGSSNLILPTTPRANVDALLETLDRYR